MLFLQELSDGAQSGPVPERPQRGQFRRALRNRRTMSCGARQMALAERVRMSWVQWRRSLPRHARRLGGTDEGGEVGDFGAGDAETGAEVIKKGILSFLQVLARPSMM